MKYFLLVFLCVGGILRSYAQSSYYASDSVSHWGVAINDNGPLENSRYCEVQEEAGVKRFSPYEIDKYQLEDSRLYISREISCPDSICKVFLEQILNGRINLYYYLAEGKRAFLVEKGDTVLQKLVWERDKNKEWVYRAQIETLTDDRLDMTPKIQRVNYSRRSLRRFFTLYNQGEKVDPWKARFGVSTGLAFVQPTLSTKNVPLEAEPLTPENKISYHAGLWGELLMGTNGLSVFSELGFASYVSTVSSSSSAADLDLMLKYTVVELPLMLRYSRGQGRLVPFVNGGLLFAKNFLRQSDLYYGQKRGNVVELDFLKNVDVLPAFQIGFSFGGGIKTALLADHDLALELRYSSLKGSDSTGGQSELKLSLSYSF